MTYQLYKKFGGILLAAISVAMVACQDDESAELSQSVYPESITLNIPEEVKPLIYKDENGTNVLPLLKGETVQLGCTILPENVTSMATNIAKPNMPNAMKAIVSVTWSDCGSKVNSITCFPAGTFIARRI